MAGRLWSWLRDVFAGRTLDRDMSAEMRFHVDARADHWRAQGVAPDEAMRRARLEFGGVDRLRDECRQSIGLQWLDESTSDIRLAGRRLARTPAFTIVAVTVLGVTIGAAGAVFSVLGTVMLEPLPVARPHQLRELAWVQSGDSTWQMSYDGSRRPYPGVGLVSTSFSFPVFEFVRRHTTAFSDVVAFSGANVNTGIAGRYERLNAQLVSGNFLSGLGIPIALGRPFIESDDEPGAAPAVVVSHGLWQRAFSGGADVVGQTLTVNGVAATVVGVTSASFRSVDPGSNVDVYLPFSPFMAAIEADRRSSPTYWAFRVMARVHADADDAQVAMETDALVRQALPPEYARDLAGFGVIVGPGGQGSDSLRRNYGQQLYLLLAIMGAALLVACGNIACLMIARTATRTRELGVRLALGAARGRLVRQLFTEGVLVAVAGTAVGAPLTLALRGAVLPALSQHDGGLSVVPASDGWLIVFLAITCIVVAVLCGLLPAWRAGTADAARLSSRNESGTGAAPRLFAGKTLIATQVALSMLLLAAAGLFLRSLGNLQSTPLGFTPDDVLLAQFDGTASGYADTRLQDLYARILERVTGTPGVEAASLSRYGLIGGGATRDSIIAPGVADGQQELSVHVHFVSGRHFETLGIPFVAGRDFLDGDREGAPRVAIVNETLARRLSAGATPVGTAFLYDRPDAPIEIVGMAADARFSTVREPAPPTIYLPYRQHRQHRMTLSVRAAGNPALLAEPVRQAIAAVEPTLPISLKTQQAQIHDALSQERTFAFVASGFALLAVLLANLGVYGTLSYSVSGRTAEIGLRVALGAQRAGIVRMVLRESLVPTLVGIVVGLGAAVMTTTYLEGMLFGLAPDDPATLAAAAATLVASALVASLIPSWRASRVDPIVALRT